MLQQRWSLHVNLVVQDDTIRETVLALGLMEGHGASATKETGLIEELEHTSKLPKCQVVDTRESSSPVKKELEVL
jgi:hypothetical protein